MINTNSLNTRQWLIVALVVVTAIIHLVLARTAGPTFVLNGLGYLALGAALYFVPPLAPYRSWIRWALIAFTALTFVLYFVLRPPATWVDALGLITKAIESVIIVLLLRGR